MAEWTRERHEDAKQRCENATPGPWSAFGDASVVRNVVGIDRDGNPYLDHPELVASANSIDAEFIAESRTDLPDALEHIEVLQDEMNRLWQVVRESLIYANCIETLADALDTTMNDAELNMGEISSDTLDMVQSEQAHGRKMAARLREKATPIVDEQLAITFGCEAEETVNG